MNCADDVNQSIPDFQAGRGGQNPTSALHFSPCSLRDVSAFVKLHHYSHSHQATNILYAFKIQTKSCHDILGAALFGFMGGNPKAMCVIEGHEDPHEYQELSRLVLLDRLPKNTESCFIAWCIRWLKKHTKLIALISFADPEAGHSGTIYRASNWVYTGLQSSSRNRLIVEGRDVHPRQLYNMYGTSSVVKLRQRGLNMEEKPRIPKHRFVYILREGLKLKPRLILR